MRQTSSGFTLIELVIAVAVLVILAALTIPIYTRILDHARVTRAVGDINAVTKEVAVFQSSRGCLPPSLADIGRSDLLDPWGRAYQLVVPPASAPATACNACGSQCAASGAARLDAASIRLNLDYDIFSTGKDGLSAAAISAAVSQDDVVRGRTGGFIGRASTY
jgi:general secretion pathway protein G